MKGFNEGNDNCLAVQKSDRTHRNGLNLIKFRFSEGKGKQYIDRVADRRNRLGSHVCQFKRLKKMNS